LIHTEFDELEKLVENYDKRVRPFAGEKAAQVNISLYVLNIPYINFGKHGMEMTLDMYYRQFWDDPRLKIDKSLNLPKILGEKEIIEKIWVPDTFFINEHSSKATENFLRITDGRVLWSQKMQVTFTSDGDYSRFPFDSQVFPIEMESFKYTAKDIVYGWNDDEESVQMNPSLGFTDLTLVGHRQMQVLAKLETGAYSRIWVEIQVDRKSEFFSSILFVPLFLTTMFSFLSLWIDVKQRLLFVLLVNFFTVAYKIWFRVYIAPPVSYSFIAIEYIDMCLSINILLLIETILFMRLNNTTNHSSSYGVELEKITLDEEESNIRIVKQNEMMSGKRFLGVYLDQDRVDHLAKIFLPVLFIFCQICFWIYVATMEKHELEGIVKTNPQQGQ